MGKYGQKFFAGKRHQEVESLPRQKRGRVSRAFNLGWPHDLLQLVECGKCGDVVSIFALVDP